MSTVARRSLLRAEAIRLSFGPAFEAERHSLLSRLAGSNLANAKDLERLHELLCFARAWPDSPRILRLTRAELQRFARRSDLQRFRTRLSDSGIAGTDMHYRFFHPTAHWLAARWPDHVHIDWTELENPNPVLSVMRLIGTFAERQGLASYGYDARELMERMRGSAETDAAFLLAAFDDLEMGVRVRETQYDALEMPLRLSAGATTPSRTKDWFATRPIHYQRAPLVVSRAKSGGRLDLEGGDPVRPVQLSRRRGRQLVNLARGALVARQRDLDSIAYADAGDVQLADCGRGFQVAVLGVIPERRFLLECEHGFLMLENGLPIGYGCTWALFGSCQLNFNLFPTFRGSAAAWLYARVCALFEQLYGCDTFVVEPYQLGYENDEAITSGAWWFYAKLGFRPREADALAIARLELANKRQLKTYRTPRRTLRTLALEPMFLSLGPTRRDVLGELEPEAVGLAVAQYLSHHYGSERRRGERECRTQVTAWLDLDEATLSRAQRLWLQRWSPLLVALGGIERWPKRDRTDLAAVIRAKGDTDQARYVRRFDAHHRLRQGVIRLMRSSET